MFFLVYILVLQRVKNFHLPMTNLFVDFLRTQNFTFFAKDDLKNVNDC